MKSSIPNLFEQWYKLVEYAKMSLSLTGVSYLFTWRKTFMVTRGEVWSHELLRIRFLFTVSVSNAKLERMFSNLKHIKTNFCCSLGVKRLENILKIMEEVSNWENFDLISAMKKWSIDRIRRTAEEKESRSYQSRNSAKVNVKSLNDDDSYDEKKNISENGREEVYLFSCDSE